jgi:hypothetical protein
MGFGTTGVLIEENFTNEKINQNLKYYLEIWLYKLNYKNYSEFLFEVDLQLHSESKESDVLTLANDFKESQIEKNRFILWELITLNGILKYFEQVFEFYNIEKSNLKTFTTEFESDFEKFKNQKIIEFIELNLNNISIYNNRDFDYFRAEIKNFNKYQILYLHVLMYFDFIKIKDFLNSKFNHNYPIENYLGQPTNQPQKDQETMVKDYKNEYWFIVGLSFATGEMDLLLKQYNRNFTQIANKHFNNKNYRQYINETANFEQYDTDKNIYKRPKKLQKIHQHCIENKIEMIEFFIQKFNDCEPK